MTRHGRYPAKCACFETARSQLSLNGDGWALPK
jgi:hypothetical protein